ncbi:MFS transporter [Gandjariella thermophila]|uniref:Major facilitator superfamily (MFS) profile domain-containing protein n=1 Tax=Gandjariella thermophila TaxID=1931992 RepID=A0A4D4IZY4_9PSEU|nr:MFS transporter [Gandjariella thermophila]GDY28372.1 hypothetical protein GTS_00050 [Gandjariella thermophila]
MSTTSNQAAPEHTRAGPGQADPAPPADSRRWWALCVIALAQLMVVLDMTIVNIALPHTQRDLHISDADRQWVVTAYTLAFGGLLLLGGRVADLVGRKRTFLIGLVGFGVASALGGAATGAAMLFGARALQGVFAAVLAPSALSLLSTTFSEPRERSRAFGVYGALAGGGSAIGLIAGGVLTEKLDWRWCMYVNVPIAVVAVLGGLALLRDRPSEHAVRRLDIPGVLLGCGGLLAIVYGFSEAESRGWTDSRVLGLLLGGLALLALFVLVEARSPGPLLPLHILTDRNRGGAFLAVALVVIGMFGQFLFLTYFLQVTKGYSPIRTGLAFLPLTAAIVTGSTQVSARLMTRVPTRLLIVPGALIAATGMVLMTRLRVDSDYTSLVLPAELLLGFGMGLVMMPSMNTATSRVAPRDAGVTSATVNTSQQVGGSIGTALLNTIAATATTRYLADHPRQLAVATVHGYTVAIWWAVGVLVLAALVAAALINADPRRQAAGPPPAARAAPAPAPQPAGTGSELRGRVTAVDGSGVPAAALTLIDPAGHQIDQTTTNEDGRYRLAAPRGGDYVLITSATGYQPEAAPVTLGAGAVEFPVRLAGASGLSGTVQLAGARTVVAGALAVLADARGEVVASTTTGADGRYTFDGLPPGDYTLAVSHAGHHPTALPVRLRDQAPAEQDVELTGHAALSGTVRDRTGRPVAHARVALLDPFGIVVDTATTDGSGTYRFVTVCPGDYTVIASGYAPTVGALVVDSAEPVRFDIELGHARL